MKYNVCIYIHIYIYAAFGVVGSGVLAAEASKYSPLDRSPATHITVSQQVSGALAGAHKMIGVQAATAAITVNFRFCVWHDAGACAP